MDERGREAVAAIRAAFERVIADGLDPASVSGAADEQIAAFAAAQDVNVVPAAVREVLRLIGVRHGLWQAGSSLEFHVIDGADLGGPDPPVWLVTEGEAAHPVWRCVTRGFYGISPDVDAYRSRLNPMVSLGRRTLPSWAEHLR